MCVCFIFFVAKIDQEGSLIRLEKLQGISRNFSCVELKRTKQIFFSSSGDRFNYRSEAFAVFPPDFGFPCEFDSVSLTTFLLFAFDDRHNNDNKRPKLETCPQRQTTTTQ